MAKKKHILKIELEPKYMKRLQEIAKIHDSSPEELARFYLKLTLLSMDRDKITEDALMKFKPVEEIEGVSEKFSENVDKYIYGDEK